MGIIHHKDKQNQVNKTEQDEKIKIGDEVIFSSSDNRNNLRVNVEFEVTLTGPHSFFTGFTMDISEGGVFVATHRIFPIGTELRINLKIGDDRLDINSRVVWIRNVDSSKISGQEPGMGLKFIDLDENALLVISGFIKKREPLFYDSQL